MDKRFLAILAGLVIIFGGIFIVSQNSSGNGSSGSSNGGSPTNHVEGKGQKKVTLVEYGDYQCPICGAYYQPLKQVFDKYSNDIYFQFRNLPLISIHPNAFAAARAAEAAGMQNKYWEMHDMLYENQNAWSSSNNVLSVFQTYGKSLGLNVDKFKADYASDAVNKAVNADLAEFKKTGKQQATPTFFLDGQYVDNNSFSDPRTGAPSLDKFSEVLDKEIAKKNSSNQ
jgi:protein-disulfide isomerase